MVASEMAVYEVGLWGKRKRAMLLWQLFWIGISLGATG
jgi:hypothetical protein